MNLLFVEDDPALTAQLLTALASAGHEVQHCADGTQALRNALDQEWDAILMDVTIPGMDGYEVVRRLRAGGRVAPVIFLTARGEVTDRIHGLEAGGDDYLTKPFATAELLARLEAMHRRQTRLVQSSVPARAPEGWALDPVRRTVTVRDDLVELQPREWSLLDVLIQNEGKVLTKSFLLDKIWNIRYDPGTNVVDAAVFRLRRKLDPPSGPSHIETRRGEGYVFHRHEKG